MTQQIFITKRECLNPRWQEAFDSAFYCSHKNFLLDQTIDDDAICWLDISQLSADDRIPLLQLVVRKTDKVMVMTDEQSDQEAMLVMQNGAVGYCHYLAAPEQLQEIASVVAQGRLWIGAQLMQKLLTVASKAVSKTGSNEDLEQHLQQLTPRERMVAIEVGKGASNKEIAERLDITERTVKAHVSVIFDKLNVRDRVKLALLINNLSKNSASLTFSTMA